MKKTNILVLSLLSIGALVACGGTGSQTEATCPSLPSEECPTCPTCPEPEKTEFAISLKEGFGSKVTLLTESGKQGYKAGTEVAFKVEALSAQYEISSVVVDGKSLALSDEYTFVMPNKDVEISTTAIVLGDDSVLTPAAFTDEAFAALPGDVASLYTYLSEHKAENGLLLSEASYKETSSSPTSYTNFYDVKIKAGINDVLKVDGFFAAPNATIKNSYHLERGMVDGRYYEVENNSKVKIKKVSNLEDVPSNEIGLAEAQTNVSFYDVFDRFNDEYFDSYYFNWTDATVEKKLSEDKTTVTYQVALEKVSTSSYSDGYVVGFSLVMDGNSFVTGIDLNYKTYANSEYVDGVLKEDAVVKEERTALYTATRGYKQTLPKVDLRNYVSSDYDVFTKSYVGSKSFYTTNGGETYVGSTLSFTFRNRDEALVTPTLVGCNEGEEGIVEISTSTAKVLQEGVFHLNFDNGLGEIKTIEFKTVKPAPQSMTVSLDKESVFVGDSAKLTVKITPEGCDAKALVVKNEGSVDCTIVDNGDGTFTITGTVVGTISLRVSSAVEPSVYKDVKLTVVEKPNYDAIYTTITTKTIHAESRYNKYDINFETDGTGIMRNQEDDGWGSFTDTYYNFTWTLDQSSLDFVITEAEGGDSDTKLKDVVAASTSSFSVDLDYFGVKTYTATVVERVVFQK